MCNGVNFSGRCSQVNEFFAMLITTNCRNVVLVPAVNTPDSKTSESLDALSDLCRQLSELIKTDPIEKMESQIQQHRQQNESHLKWLDEAMMLLTEVSQINEAAKAPQIIAKVESFISKATRDDYHEVNQHENNQVSGRTVGMLEQIVMPGCGGITVNEVPKKN